MYLTSFRHTLHLKTTLNPILSLGQHVNAFSTQHSALSSSGMQGVPNTRQKYQPTIPKETGPLEPKCHPNSGGRSWEPGETEVVRVLSRSPLSLPCILMLWRHIRETAFLVVLGKQQHRTGESSYICPVRDLQITTVPWPQLEGTAERPDCSAAAATPAPTCSNDRPAAPPVPEARKP